MDSLKQNKVTLEHIALAAGVSKITVSRALSFSDKVKSDTRDKVFQIAEKLGYFPSRRPSNTAKKNLIGIINPNMSNPFFGELAKIMTKISLELDYDILIFDSYESQVIEERSIRRLIEYNAKAIILSTISSDKNYRPSYMEQLDKLNIPVVLVDREIGDGKYNGVYIDNVNCGEQAACYINKKDYDEIIVIAGPENSTVSIERLSGFLNRVKAASEKVKVFYADFFIDGAYSIVKKAISGQNKSYGFIGLNNQISLGILKACLENNLVYQQDFDLFSIDNLPYADSYGLNVPCVSHNLYEIAYQSIHLAIRAISGGGDNVSKIIVRGYPTEG